LTMQNFRVLKLINMQKIKFQLKYSMQTAMCTIRKFGSIINSYTLSTL